MSWKLAHIDNLPGDGQEILLSVDGNKYVGFYDSTSKSFHVEGSKLDFWMDDDIIHWKERKSQSAR